MGYSIMTTPSQKQIDELLETSLSTSQLRLQQAGYCPPHAHYLDTEGRIIGLEVTAEDMPDATPSYETLEMLLRDLAERGDALATTIGEAMELHFEDEPGMVDGIVIALRTADTAEDYLTPFVAQETGFFRKRIHIDLLETSVSKAETNEIFG